LVGGTLCCRLRWRGRGGGSFAAQACKHGADRDGLAFLHEDLRDDSGCGRRHLRVDLVGRDLEQRLVGFDLIADLLQPPRDRPLGDAHAHLRHDDVDCGSCAHQYSINSLSARATSSTCGMYAFSRTGENGTGVSGAARRLTGASRSSNASSAIVAAISPPKPPVRVSSCSTSTFDVLRTDSRTASLSHGMIVRRSTISTDASTVFAASSAV